MFLCSCGEVFSEYEFGKNNTCPSCGSDDFEDAHECDVCGEWLSYDDLTDGTCENCIDEFKAMYRHDSQMCFKIGEKQKETIEINCFLYSQFSVEEIHNILLRELKWNEEIEFPDYSNFLNEDDEWFIGCVKEVIADEQKEGEQG